MKLETVINVLIALLFSAITCYYGFKSWGKYRDKIVAISYKKIPAEKLNFPDITFCSTETKQGISLVNHAQMLDANETLDNVEEWFHPRRHLFRIRFDKKAEDEKHWHHFIDKYGGYCHTFHPSRTSAGHEHDYLLLQFFVPENHSCRGDEGDISRCKYYAKVYFHEEGSFFFRRGHEFLGLTYEFGIPHQTDFAFLSKQENKLLDKDDYPCDENLSQQEWIQQIQDYMDTLRGCVNPWRKDISSGSNLCNVSQITGKWDISITYVNIFYLYQRTGIQRPCNFIEYSVTKSKQSDLIIEKKNKKLPDMKLLLYYSESFVERFEEYLAFDFFNMVAEMGGLCGLFLGFSCYPITLSGISKLRLRFQK